MLLYLSQSIGAASFFARGVLTAIRRDRYIQESCERTNTCRFFNLLTLLLTAAVAGSLTALLFFPWAEALSAHAAVATVLFGSGVCYLWTEWATTWSLNLTREKRRTFTIRCLPLLPLSASLALYWLSSSVSTLHRSCASHNRGEIWQAMRETRARPEDACRSVILSGCEGQLVQLVIPQYVFFALLWGSTFLARSGEVVSATQSITSPQKSRID